MQHTFKNKDISIPETDFLKGKVMILYSEARAATGYLLSLGSEVEASCLRSAKFKPLSDNCQRRSGRESIEAWPSTGRSLQQDISDMPLWLLKCSLNIHLEVLLIRQTRACVHCIAALGGAGLKKSDRKCSLRFYFLLGAEKTLLSYYKKLCKMIR